jgi:hypothetical protein
MTAKTTNETALDAGSMLFLTWHVSSNSKHEV